MKSTTSEIEAAREAIRVLGGPVKAARLLGVRNARHQTVQSWLRTRVPSDYCPAIEEETRKAGQPVYCERLRADVRWTALRGVQLPAELVGEVRGGAHDDSVGSEAAAVHTNSEAKVV